jgi:hypothetical protein
MEVAGDMFELELIKKEGECGELGPQHTFAISPPKGTIIVVETGSQAMWKASGIHDPSARYFVNRSHTSREQDPALGSFDPEQTITRLC